MLLIGILCCVYGGVVKLFGLKCGEKFMGWRKVVLGNIIRVMFFVVKDLGNVM